MWLSITWNRNLSKTIVIHNWSAYLYSWLHGPNDEPKNLDYKSEFSDAIWRPYCKPHRPMSPMTALQGSDGKRLLTWRSSRCSMWRRSRSLCGRDACQPSWPALHSPWYRWAHQCHHGRSMLQRGLARPWGYRQNRQPSSRCEVSLDTDWLCSCIKVTLESPLPTAPFRR